MILALAASLILGITGYAAGGTAGDPLISLSYLKTVFTPKIEQQAAASADKLLQQSQTALDTAYENKLDKAGAQMEQLLHDRVAQKVIDKLAQQGMAEVKAGMREITVYQGEQIVGTPGAGIIMVSGAGKICGPAGSEVVNITAGGVRTPGMVIRTGIYYMVTADNASGIEVTSASAKVLVQDGCRIAGRYAAQYTDYADALKFLGLFLGSNNGYELDRAPTRQEALIMLIRLLGEEQAALRHSGQTHFTDLTGWPEGHKYIAYGADMGYTKGDGTNTFSQYKTADAYMYVTFVLRSLGYSDAAGDFVWNSTSLTLAQQLGLLTAEDVAEIRSTGLMRDHVAKISYNALSVKLKGSSQTLGNKLVGRGVITNAQLQQAAQYLK